MRYHILRAIVACMSGATLWLAGCQAPPGAPASPGALSSSAHPAISEAGAASMTARLRVEVLLHAALYRAAFETRVSAIPRCLLLEPAHDPDPPAAPIDREFSRQVIESLADLQVALAWATPLTDPPSILECWSDTDDPVTRLRIRIISRMPELATVSAEISDCAGELGSSCQRVTATWDGVHWNLERDRVRLVW